MAMELSPRISFSHDISPSTAADAQRLDDALPMDPTAEFDFSISYDISFEAPSPADELFSNGKLLPLSSVKSTSTYPSPPPQQNSPLPAALVKKENIKDMLADSNDCDESSSRKSVSFWHIGRSSSVGGSGGSKSKLGSICSFPRSKSTGSHLNPNPNPNSISNKNRQNSRSSTHKQEASTNNHVPFRKALMNDSNAKTYYYSGSKRVSYGNGVRISPVLNVPAPFIPRGGSGSSSGSGGGGGGSGSGSNFFAYLLCNCRDKNMKRSEVSCSL